MHIFIHTYEHTRTHTKEGVRVVSDYQHMYFILQGRINKNRYFIFTGSYFFCRGCCQVRSGHHYVEMSGVCNKQTFGEKHHPEVQLSEWCHTTPDTNINCTHKQH